MSEFIPLQCNPNYGVNRDGVVIHLVLGNIQKPYYAQNGYPTVVVGIKRQSRHIHRLLALAFIPNPNNYKVVHHIDGNRANSVLSNLEWSTQSANVKAGYDAGRVRGRKISDEIRDYIMDMKGILSAKELAEKFNVGARHVRKILRGESRAVSVRGACHI